METGSKWLEDITRHIGALKDTLTPKEYKKFKLDYLLRLARRVAEFSEICPQCQTCRPDIDGLMNELGNVTLMDKTGRKQYSRKMKEITQHLKKAHKLVAEGQYMGMLAGIGWVAGTALGTALDSAGIETGIGMSIGIMLGYGVGALLDYKAKKEGRVI